MGPTGPGRLFRLDCLTMASGPRGGGGGFLSIWASIWLRWGLWGLEGQTQEAGVGKAPGGLLVEREKDLSSLPTGWAAHVTLKAPRTFLSQVRTHDCGVRRGDGQVMGGPCWLPGSLCQERVGLRRPKQELTPGWKTRLERGRATRGEWLGSEPWLPCQGPDPVPPSPAPHPALQGAFLGA